MYKDREKQREAVRRYYDRNRDIYRAKNDRKRARLRQMVIEAKAVPCMDCGQVVPAYVMDFDHRDGKESEISVLVNTLSVRRLVAEMAKCDVVCANCHRIRTYGQPDEARHWTATPDLTPARVPSCAWPCGPPTTPNRMTGRAIMNGWRASTLARLAPFAG